MIKYTTLKIKRHVIKQLTCGKNFLDNLYGQFSGFQGFVVNLKSSRLLLFLM